MSLKVLYLDQQDVLPPVLPQEVEQGFSLKSRSMSAYLDADLVYFKGRLVKDSRRLNDGPNVDKILMLEEVLSDLKH